MGTGRQGIGQLAIFYRPPARRGQTGGIAGRPETDSADLEHVLVLRHGFSEAGTAVVDFETWSRGTRAEKIKPMARHWAEVGFGTPVALHLFYVVKILLYILVAALLALTTRGNGRVHRNMAVVGADRLREGRALHDAVRGGRFRLRVRPAQQPFLPPMGSIMYWLRPARSGSRRGPTGCR